MSVVDEAKLGYLDFLSREDRVRHHRYVEEMKQYDMMRSGDINAHFGKRETVGFRTIRPSVGRSSEKREIPFRHYHYLGHAFRH